MSRNVVTPRHNPQDPQHQFFTSLVLSNCKNNSRINSTFLLNTVL